MAIRVGWTLPVLLALWLFGASLPVDASVAFFYGRGIPDEARLYDAIVLQPSQVTSSDLSVLSKQGTQPLAYLTIGEVAHTASESAAIPADWRLGKNEEWGSDVLDIRLPEVQTFLVETMAKTAWTQGFRGFFLDTLDSYRLTDEGKADESGFQNALVAIIQRLSVTFKGATVILNRGFEIASRVELQIQGVAFESLFSRYNVAEDRYEPVPDGDREWLLAQVLPLVRDRHVQVIAIDYVPAGAAEADALIHQIEALGLHAWVADGRLATMGKGSGRRAPEVAR